MSSTELPFVSICLLTYKRAKVLSRSIDCLLAQTHANFELIINDDNSPDETETVCREYEKRDARIRYYRNPVNLRYAGNQNAALERAKSDYVAIVHDGDLYRSDLIEQWVRALVTYPTAAIAFSALDAIDLDGRKYMTYITAHPPLIRGCELLDNMLTRPDSPIFGIVMVRKSYVQRVGPFDTRLATLADVDMWMRLLRHYDAAYVPEPLVQRMDREGDHYNRAGNWRVREEYVLIYRLNFFRRYPQPDPQGEQVRHYLNRMLLKQYIHQMGWCLKRLHLAEFTAGLRYYWTKGEWLRWPRSAAQPQG